MSEELKTKGPEFNADRLLPTAEKAEPLREGEADPSKTAEKSAAEARKDLNEIKAESSDELRDQLNATESAPVDIIEPQRMSSADLKITANRSLHAVQRRLSSPKRAMSKVIHQPAVRAVSEGASKTVSRPSGLLGGGLLAFLGSSGYLYLAKHIGFEYNYLVFILLFAGGFILGVVLELLVFVATAKRRVHN